MKAVTFLTAVMVGAAMLWAQEPAAQTVQLPIYLEDSPAAQELIDRAERLVRQDRLIDAAALYQQAIDEYPHKLMAIEPELHTDTVRWVRRALLADEALLAAYRRSYEPQAARLLQEATRGGPRAEALETVVARFALCRSGLEATLLLAGVYLERADTAAAASVLDEIARHPDLAEDPSRYHQLQATVGLLASDDPRLEQARQAMRERTDHAGLATIDALADRLSLPHTPRPLAPQDDAPAFDPSTSLQAPLWEIATTPSSAVEMTEPYSQFPLATTQHLYVNDGMMIVAVDRSSGRRLWSHGEVEAMLEADRTASLVQLRNLWPDPRGVALEGPRLFGIVGYGNNMIGRWRNLSTATRLVCLDRESGRVLWQVEPGDLDPTLDRAFFHGTPVTRHGQVYVLMRRSQVAGQVAGFHDAFVAAIDSATGQLQWRRHLSSASATSRYSRMPLGQMVLHQGRLYISDYLGSITCVDTRTGSIAWLRLMQEHLPPAERLGRVTRGDVRPLLSQPLLVSAGLLVPPGGGDASMVLLDPDTGNVRQRLDDAFWRGAHYFLPAGDDVLVMGMNVTLLDGRTLESRWRYTLGTRREDGPSGLAGLTDRAVLIPTGNRLVMLDLSDGTPLAEPRLDGGGNVLALENHQLVIASGRTVRSYMAWPRAYQNLQQQIAANPMDPMPGLALAHLAIATDHPNAALEGVEHAIAALGRLREKMPDPNGKLPEQSRVFSQLLRFLEPDSPADVAMRGRLLDHLATITATAADEATYLFHMGAWLADAGRTAEAVDQYQAILQDATLSAQLHRSGGSTRQAWMEAKRRLQDLVNEHGPAIYARYDAVAAQRLAELTAPLQPDAQRLVDLVRTYPLARTAPATMLAAAEAFARQGDLKAAVVQARLAYRSTRNPDQLAQIVGQLVQWLDDADRVREAYRWLRVAYREHPQLQPLRRGRPEVVEDWLEELFERARAGLTLPQLHLPLDEPFVLQGRLLTPLLQPEREWPRDRFILQLGNRVQLHTPDRREHHWVAAMPSTRLQLLWFSAEQVILWQPDRGELYSLNGQTGKPDWPAIKALELLEQVGDLAQRDADRPAEQRRFIAMIDPAQAMMPGHGLQDARQRGGPPVLLTGNDLVMVAADRSGRVIGLDRRRGQVLWQLMCPMQWISHLSMDEDSVVVAGQTDPGTDAQSSHLAVLDAFTGEMRIPTIEEKEPLRYVGLSGDGMLFYATANEVVAHQVGTGEVVWRNATEGLNISGQGIIGAETLMLMLSTPAEQPMGVLAVDAHNGQSQVIRLPTESRVGMGATLNLVEADDRWHLLSPAQAMALERDGRIAWRDAIAEMDKGLLLQQVGERFVVLWGRGQAQGGAQAAHIGAGQGGDRQVQIRLRAGGQVRLQVMDPRDEQIEPPQRGWYYSLYLLDREGGSILEEQRIGPLTAPINAQSAMFLNNHLVVNTTVHTVIVPGSPPEDRP